MKRTPFSVVSIVQHFPSFAPSTFFSLKAPSSLPTVLGTFRLTTATRHRFLCVPCPSFEGVPDVHRMRVLIPPPPAMLDAADLPENMVIRRDTLPQIQAWADLRKAETKEDAGETGGHIEGGHPRDQLRRGPLISPSLPPAQYAALETKAAVQGEHCVTVLAVIARVRGAAKASGGRLVEAIPLLHAELVRLKRKEGTHSLVKAMLHAVLGNWLGAFFQENRWRIRERSESAAVRPAGSADSDDINSLNFTEWGTARLLQTVNRQYAAALEGDALALAPLTENYPLLHGFEDSHVGQGDTGSESSDQLLLLSLRPTLFDVVAHEALHFFEMQLHNPEGLPFDDEVTEAACKDPSRLLADRHTFIKWALPSAPRNPKVGMLTM